MAGPLALLGKLQVIKSGLDFLGGKKQKQKQQPDKSKALNFMGEKPASDAVVDVDAEVVGTETVGASANVVPQTTMVPDINISPVGDGGVGSIVNQINEINSNIAAISQAMQSSADIEAKYRKDLEESIQQDIADRDKLQARKRAENRRDSFGKKLLSGPKKVAGVVGNTASKGLGLEFLAQLLNDEGTTETDQNVDKSVDEVGKDETINLLNQEQEDKNKKGNWFTNFFRGTVMRENAEYERQIQRVETGETPRYGFFGPINKTTNNNETNNEMIDEINNNTTTNNSTNKTTKVNEKIIKGDLSTITFDGKTYPRGKPGLGGYIPGDGKGGSTYSEEWQQSNQVNPNSIEKSAGSLIAGITGAVDKTVPVEDQKGSIRVFDMRKGKGKGDGGTTIGKGVSDEVPSLSPERGVSLNEIFQRSSVA